MSLSRENLGLVLGVIGVCLFANTLPATRLAVAALDPLFLTAARVTLAGCAASVLLLATRRPLPPRELRMTLLAAGTCTALVFPLVTAFAMMTIPAAHGGVVLGIMPLATTVCAAIVAHERPSAGFWAASVAGAALVLVFMLHRSGFEGAGIGDLFLLGSVISGSLGYTLSGRLTAAMPGWEVISWSVLIYFPVAAVATVILWPPDVASVPLSAWGGLAYVGFISQYLSFFVFNAGMAMGGLARVGQMLLLQPFVIVAMAWPINGERIELETILFAAAVVVVVLIGQRMRVARQPGTG